MIFNVFWVSLWFSETLRGFFFLKDKVNFYDCQCLLGWEGQFCTNNIDDCLVNDCRSNSTCIDGIANYSCLCRGGFEGRNCEINIDDCKSNPCLNGGKLKANAILLLYL